MAEKILRILQSYSKSELMQFLQKNGHEEFVEILNNGGITDGQHFLNLTELQILKWKLPPAVKRKLMSFLKEVKENPQKFVAKSETDRPTILNRRQSLRTKPDFKSILEQVITTPKSQEVKQVKPPAPLPNGDVEPIQHAAPISKRPAAAPPKIEKDRAPSPQDEYLPMDRGKSEDTEEHDDDNDYLIPVDKPPEVEENDYEPPPSDRIVTSFASSIPRKNDMWGTRAPLALPRESTDGDYINGPEGLEAPNGASTEPHFFPRIQRNQASGHFKPKINVPTAYPSPQPPKIRVQEEIRDEEEEDAFYEPVDYGDQEPPGRPSPAPINVDAPAGSLATKLFGLLRNPRNYENSEIKGVKVQKSESLKAVGARAEHKNHARKMTARPLPPLPPSENELAVSKRTEPKATLEEPLEVYENVNKNLSAEDIQRLHTQLSNALNIKEFKGSKWEKSQSENNLATAEESVVYGNVDENNEPKYRQSYEENVSLKNRSGKNKLPFTLPLPPTSLPQIRLEEAIFPQSTDNGTDPEGESEDYGNFIFNINDEPFYRNTDRKGAKQLLSRLGNGAFLLRPSSSPEFFLTISLKYDSQYYNVGIVKTENNKIRLSTSGDNMSPEFATLTDFVLHFTREKITFEHKGKTIQTYLSRSLQPDVF